MQLSSANCPKEIREELCRLGRMCALLAFDDSWFELKLTVPWWDALIVVLSGNRTVGPKGFFVILDRVLQSWIRQ
jgi:hypothetical protein